MRRQGRRHLAARAAARLALTFAVLSSAAVLARAQSAGPASVAFVVDNSSSMRDSAAGKRLREALQRLVESEDARNEYFIIIAATTDVNKIEGTPRAVDAPSASRLLRKLYSGMGQGATALYDACVLALVKLGNARHPNRLILVVSDGVDTVSGTSLEDLENLLKDTGVRLSAVGVECPEVPPALGPGKGLERLRRLAAASGGSVFHLKKKAEKEAVYEGVKALFAPAVPTR